MGIGNHFWPLESRFLMRKNEKKSIFSKTPNLPILSFWILNLHIIICQFQKRSTVKHFFSLSPCSCHLCRVFIETKRYNVFGQSKIDFAISLTLSLSWHRREQISDQKDLWWLEILECCDKIPNGHQGKPKEEAKRSSKFSDQRLPGVDQLLGFHLLKKKILFLTSIYWFYPPSGH